jgi:hypothetical protein
VIEQHASTRGRMSAETRVFRRAERKFKQFDALEVASETNISEAAAKRVRSDHWHRFVSAGP